MKNLLLTLIILLFSTLTAFAQITITESGGGLETVYVKWTPFVGTSA